jgi:hypothetical protein
MSFLINEDNNYFLTTLTQKGRELLSYGNLNYKKFVVWDNEVDYTIVNDTVINTAITITDNFNIIANNNFPNSINTNLDGSKPYEINKIFAAKYRNTGTTVSLGFFSSTTNTTNIDSYYINKSLCVATGTTNSPLGRFGIGGASGFTSPGNSSLNSRNARIAINQSLSLPNGGLVMFKFSSHGSNVGFNSNAPFGCLWFRYSAITDAGILASYPGATPLDLDRDLPRMQNLVKTHMAYFYPFDGQTYYGSATTICPVWSMNIVHTKTQKGTGRLISSDADYDFFGLNDGYYQARYTIYGSKNYNGQTKLFGFSEPIDKIGFVHYTNSSSANTFLDEFCAGLNEIDLPTIMWHRTPAIPGTAVRTGVKFTDKNSPIYYDNLAKSPYTLLKDNYINDNYSVGRCYFKLKLFVITDQELLTVMSYKSNRNWTMPKLEVSLAEQPNPYYSSGSPLCLSNKVYYFSYGIRMYVPDGSSANMGYRQVIPCGYATRFETPANLDSCYVKVGFPNNSFPYLRKRTEITTYSGTGWTCGRVHLLVQEVDKSKDTGVNGLSNYDWKFMDNYNSQVSTGYVNSGSLSQPYANSIDPIVLNNFVFTPIRQDFDNARKYNFDLSGEELHRAFYQNIQQERLFSKLNLTLGDESVFFGNVNVVPVENRYKTIIPIEIKNTEINKSLNYTFNEDVNDSTFITSIGIMNENNELVAIAKPKNPIEKNLGKHLKIQLEIDF